MLSRPGSIHWSGGCEYRESIDITLVPEGGGAVARVVRDRRPAPFTPVPPALLAEFLAELRRLLAAPVGPGDLGTADDLVTIDLPLSERPIRHRQALADDGPSLDPIVGAIHRLADALAPA
jgi:hypothetical protein